MINLKVNIVLVYFSVKIQSHDCEDIYLGNDENELFI